MIYIFHGIEYHQVYDKAYQYGLTISKNIFTINHDAFDYNDKDEMIAVFKHLLCIPDNDEHTVMLIESIELIPQGVLQGILPIIDRIFEFQKIIIVTADLKLVPTFLSSRAVIEYVDTLHDDFNAFVKKFIENKDFFQIEQILESFHVTANNTKEVMIIFQSKHALKLSVKQQCMLDKIIINYLSYIPNMYVSCWKFIFLLINQ